MQPAPTNARIPNASAARNRFGKFVTEMEITLKLDLRRIATNTGECERGVNADVQGRCSAIGARYRGGEKIQKMREALGPGYLVLLPSVAFWRRRRRSQEEDDSAARKST
jgi:hypothetical protein